MGKFMPVVGGAALVVGAACSGGGESDPGNVASPEAEVPETTTTTLSLEEEVGEDTCYAIAHVAIELQQVDPDSDELHESADHLLNDAEVVELDLGTDFFVDVIETVGAIREAADSPDSQGAALDDALDFIEQHCDTPLVDGTS